METKFTKGEWHISETGGFVESKINYTGKDKLICAMGISRNGNSEEITANAKLIAAAPDLFHALEKIDSMSFDKGVSGCTYGDTDFDSESVAFGYNQCLSFLKDLAKQALKKATDI